MVEEREVGGTKQVLWRGFREPEGIPPKKFIVLRL